MKEVPYFLHGKSIDCFHYDGKAIIFYFGDFKSVMICYTLVIKHIPVSNAFCQVQASLAWTSDSCCGGHGGLGLRHTAAVAYIVPGTANLKIKY
jgi:hypothetical protein